MEILEIYHGTISTCAENIIKNGILLEKGKPKVDFGQGFYTTTSYKFAQSTAKNKSDKTNMHYGENRVYPIVLKYEMDERLLEHLHILKFKEEDIRWAQFIINNRNGFTYMKDIGFYFHNLKQKFDIVIGGIADNRISLLSKELKQLKEKVTSKDLYDMKYPYHTRQISFHTQKSLACIKLVACDIIIKEIWKGDVVNE